MTPVRSMTPPLAPAEPVEPRVPRLDPAAKVPPLSMSMIWPWPVMLVLVTRRVPAVAPLSVMPTAPVAVPTRSRPWTVLPEARTMPVPAWLIVLLLALAPIVRPLTTNVPWSPRSCWLSSRVMPASVGGAIIVDEDRLAGRVDVVVGRAVAGDAIQLGQRRERVEVGAVRGAICPGISVVDVPDDVGDGQRDQAFEAVHAGYAIRVDDIVSEGRGRADVEAGGRGEGVGAVAVVDDRFRW